MIFDFFAWQIDWFWFGAGLLLGAILGWRGVVVVAAIAGYVLGRGDKKGRR